MGGAFSKEGGIDVVPLVVASALFMHLMDTAALATALPTIARAFNRDAVDLRIVLTAYVVTIAALVPASAWLSARIGTKRLFIGAMIVFATGSAVCALTQDLPQLVAARVIQGIGGAMMTPVGRTLIVRMVPRSRLVNAMTLFTLPGILAPLLGPPLAGLIVEYASWRWIFLVNLPICLGGVAAVLAVVPKLDEDLPSRFDVRGFSLIFVGMLALSALVDGGASVAGGLTVKIGLVVALGTAWWIYGHHARRSPAPILDPALLRADTLKISLWAGGFQRMAVGALPFLLPLLLQDALGMSPLAASRVMVASAIGGLAARFALPPLIRRFRVRPIMILCAAASSLATAVPALFGHDTPVVAMIGLMAGLGLVRSGYFIPATAIAYVDLEPRAIGQGTVLFTMVQQFSLSLGISISAILLDVGKGGDTLQPNDFLLPFAGVAAISGLSLLWLRRLPPGAGEELRQG